MTVFRTKKPAPTEAGWYYGRPIEYSGDVDTEICPREVYNAGGILAVRHRAGFIPLRQFAWYGPVQKIEESSCIIR